MFQPLLSRKDNFFYFIGPRWSWGCGTNFTLGEAESVSSVPGEI